MPNTDDRKLSRWVGWSFPRPENNDLIIKKIDYRKTTINLMIVVYYSRDSKLDYK
jgi:hypothetical protein